MRHLYTVLCTALLLIVASCGKKDDSPAPAPATAPEHIIPGGIMLNNVKTTAMPAGETADHFSVSLISSDDVLLAESGETYGSLPVNTGFTVPYFSYSFRSYKLKFWGRATNSVTRRPLGMITLSLADYSQDKYPQPKEMFFNKDGFAGTLNFTYE